MAYIYSPEYSTSYAAGCVYVPVEPAETALEKVRREQQECEAAIAAMKKEEQSQEYYTAAGKLMEKVTDEKEKMNAFWAAEERRLKQEKTHIEYEKQGIKEEYEALEKARKKLEEEREKMKTIAAEGKDVIELNVNGRILTTTRRTLCAEQDSILAAMFSGRYEEHISRDKEGRVMLDCDPDLFALMLKQLGRKVMVGELLDYEPFFSLSVSQQEYYRAMAQQLGIPSPSPIFVNKITGPNSFQVDFDIARAGFGATCKITVLPTTTVGELKTLIGIGCNEYLARDTALYVMTAPIEYGNGSSGNACVKLGGSDNDKTMEQCGMTGKRSVNVSRYYN